MNWTLSYVDADQAWPQELSEHPLRYPGRGLVGGWDGKNKITYAEYVAQPGRQGRRRVLGELGDRRRHGCSTSWIPGGSRRSSRTTGRSPYRSTSRASPSPEWAVSDGRRPGATWPSSGDWTRLGQIQISLYFAYALVGKRRSWTGHTRPITPTSGVDRGTGLLRRHDHARRRPRRPPTPVHVRIGFHQLAVPRAVRGRARRRRSRLRGVDLLDSDRRGAPFPARRTDHGDVGQTRTRRPSPRGWSTTCLAVLARCSRCSPGLSMDYYTPLEHRTHSFKGNS